MSAVLAFRPAACVPAPGSLARAGEVLAHRVELSEASNIDLDCDLLDWISDLPGIRSADPENPRSHRWLALCGRLVGDLTAADRLLFDVLPDARVTFDTGLSGTRIAVAAVRVPGVATPFPGAAAVRANALLAAVIRAIADWLDELPPAAANDLATSFAAQP